MQNLNIIKSTDNYIFVNKFNELDVFNYDIKNDKLILLDLNETDIFQKLKIKRKREIDIHDIFVANENNVFYLDAVQNDYLVVGVSHKLVKGLLKKKPKCKKQFFFDDEVNISFMTNEYYFIHRRHENKTIFVNYLKKNIRELYLTYTHENNEEYTSDILYLNHNNFCIIKYCNTWEINLFLYELDFKNSNERDIKIELIDCFSEIKGVKAEFLFESNLVMNNGESIVIFYLDKYSKKYLFPRYYNI